MSPASYLAAPPRVAGRIVAPASTIVHAMDWAIYGALIAGAVAITIGIIRLVREIRAGWGALKRLQEQLADDLADLAVGAERTSEIVERISGRPELETSLARLRVSLARFAVLRAAMDEVDASLLRLVSVYPRK
jgi:uncharacterized membrane protein YcjF (UPF0283 family)